MFLKRISNISQGGDSIDVTDSISEDLKSLAASAVKSIPGLHYAGLDIICEDHSLPLSQQKAYVIEVNWDPMIKMHHFPYKGRARDVAGAIIDFTFGASGGTDAAEPRFSMG